MKKRQNGRSIPYYHILLTLIVTGYFIWQTGHLGGQSWGYDEGVWAMEARLVNQGYRLYKEIYTPAPPFFILSLATGFSLFGESLETARLVSLIFASLGLIPVALISYHFYGKAAGIATLFFLAAAPDFYLYSRVPNGNQASLGIFMAGLLFAIYYYSSGRRRWLYLASTLATIGLFFKFVPAFLLPLFAVIILARSFKNEKQPSAKRLKTVGLTSLEAAGPFVIILLVSLVFFDAQAFINQVFLHHLRGQSMASAIPVPFFETPNPLLTFILETFMAYGARGWSKNIQGNLIYLLINHLGLTLLAVVGLYFLLKDNRIHFFFMVIWLLLTGVMAFLYQPMFDHLYTIYLYSLSILAGITVAGLIKLVSKQIRIKPSWVTLLETAVCLVTVGVYLYGFPEVIRYFESKAQAPQNQFLTEAVTLIEQSTTEDDWVISDIQTAAFLAGRNVPPELAETSTMRLLIHELPLEALKNWTAEYEPQIVLTGRVLQRIPGYNEWLAESYLVIWGNDEQRLFIYKRKE